MLFNLSKLCNKSIMNLSVNEKIELDNINAFGEEIIFNTPVELKGTFVNKDEYVEFNGEVSCNLKLICSKCLETFDETFEVKIDEKFSRNEQEDYFELPVSCEIDLGRIIEENIVGYLPIQKRCSESCKGLCPICGINLNLHTCECKPIVEEEEEEKLDPRFAKLQNFFNKN